MRGPWNPPPLPGSVASRLPGIAWVVFLCSATLLLVQAFAPVPFLIVPLVVLLMDRGAFTLPVAGLFLLGGLAALGFLVSGFYLINHEFRRRRILAGSFVVLVLPVISAGLAMLFLLVVFSYPTNARDNADPSARAHMAKLTLEWGRLHSFPETARDFTILTEGGSFSRSFKGSFTDTPENIEKWMQASPGIREGQDKNGVIILKGHDSCHGTIIVSPDRSKVSFDVQWS